MALKKRFLAYLELMRAGNCLIAAIATLIGYLLALSVTIGIAFFEPIIAIGAMASAFLVCAGGQVVNDVFDSTIDKKINPTKPIPSKKISSIEATTLSCCLFVLGVLLASFINGLALFIAAGFSLLLIIYSALLYKVKYVGNIVVALGTSFTFVFGATTAFEMIPALIGVLAGSAFFANMAREITKDYADLKKDKGFKKTLPMLLPKGAKVYVIFYYIAAVLLALLAFFYFNLNYGYLLFVLVSVAAFARATKQLLANKFSHSHKNSKKAMIASLIAYVLAIIH